ncbi:MAG: OmpH family outer membrane protein [Alphaproteobacteria bacterium]|nr:OmpH family outer membrane protein [Alphaproteobacteria bacterium]
MNRYLIHTLLPLVFSLVLALNPAASAAELSIAVVDVQKLLTQSEAAKSIQVQVQAEREKFLTKLSKEEESLRSMEKELMDKGQDLSQDERMEKRKAFEEKFNETQRAAQEAKARIETAVVDAMAKLNQEAFKAVEAIAEEKGYNLILAKQHVVASDKSIDISEESMERLNASIKDIKVQIEQ